MTQIFWLGQGYDETALVTVGSNTPFLLDAPDTVWIVIEGKVDVFAVQVQEGKPVDARRHLFRAEAGQALLGMALKHYGRGYGLLAVGVAGTRLLLIQRTQLEAMAHEPETVSSIAALIEDWVNGLSTGLAVNMIQPRKIELLEVGIETSVEPKVLARPRKGIAWISVQTGIARFMGWEELPLMGDDDFLPISESTWLQAVNAATFQALDTETFLKLPIAWACLENFHRMVLDLVIWNVERELSFERERLKARSEFDRSYVQNAITYLTSILTTQRGRVFVPNYGVEEPLLIACQLVGRTLGMTIRPRPDPVDGQPEPQTLETITDASRVRTRQVALRGEWWRGDNGPLLAYIEADKRPVALLPTSANQYVLHDPTNQTQQTVTAEIASMLSPFAYSFYRAFPEHQLRASDVLRFGLFGARRDVFVVLILGAAGGLLNLLPPLAIGRIFDDIIPNGDQSLLFLLAAVLVASAVAAALFQITRGIAILRIESKLDSSVQAAVWDRLLKLPVPFFRDYTAGDLSSRALGISAIRQAVSGPVVLSILSGLFSAFNFILLFFIDWRLALAASGLLLVAVIGTVNAGVRQARYQRRLTDTQGRISGMVLQIITGITKLRIAGVEGRVFAFWAREFGQQRSLSFRARDIANGLTVFNAAYTVLAALVLFAAAGYSRTDLSTGEFVAFYAAFGQFFFAGLQLSAAFIALLRVVPLYERAQPILQTVPEVTAAKADPGDLAGEIEVSRVSFRYKEKGLLVLDNVSLRVRRGEFVALVGPSGSGKSTLLRLLLGFETPESGAIFYDGQNLNGLDIRGVRRQLGVVLQNSQLITGDLFTNIVGQSRLTIDDAWEAARLAGLDEDIRQMPMGMFTFLTAGAGTISGGQRQRVLIARALARKPRILLFDEATSALDNQTQAVVSESLDKLDATRIVIAHRLSTIMSADRVVVMNKGRIVQEGTYADLMTEENSLFSELARRQLA
ncbi:MAG: NHLP bacteriocin export ABC transporter permease/ATPase subunit [Anaerolineae bacterium]|nr:NHLP bacteriocin export ABC transporter permease/ATPase subunit [Anaerolineae bacterium]